MYDYLLLVSDDIVFDTDYWDKFNYIKDKNAIFAYGRTSLSTTHSRYKQVIKQSICCQTTSLKCRQNDKEMGQWIELVNM